MENDIPIEMMRAIPFSTWKRALMLTERSIFSGLVSDPDKAAPMRIAIRQYDADPLNVDKFMEMIESYGTEKIFSGMLVAVSAYLDN